MLKITLAILAGLLIVMIWQWIIAFNFIDDTDRNERKWVVDMQGYVVVISLGIMIVLVVLAYSETGCQVAASKEDLANLLKK